MQKKQWIGILIAVAVLVLIVGFAKVASQDAQGQLRNSGRAKIQNSQQIKSGTVRPEIRPKTQSANGTYADQNNTTGEDQNNASAPNAGDACTENATYTQNYDLEGHVTFETGGQVQTWTCTMFCTDRVFSGPSCVGS